MVVFDLKRPCEVLIAFDSVTSVFVKKYWKLVFPGYYIVPGMFPFVRCSAAGTRTRDLQRYLPLGQQVNPHPSDCLIFPR